MKKTTILFGAALGMMTTGCAKVEMNQVEQVEQAIVFQPVSGSQQVTRAESYDRNESFGSYAFIYNDKPTPGANHTTTDIPQLYISNEKISYCQADITNTFVADSWHGEHVYFWPKGENSLDFYAYAPYTDGTGSNAFAVTCDVESGIKITGFDVKDKNAGIDLLVADVAKSQSANTTNAAEQTQKGVPTIFHHKLTAVGFTFRTAQNYIQNPGSFNPGDVEITLNGYKTNEKVFCTGDYSQFRGNEDQVLSTVKWEGKSKRIRFEYKDLNQVLSEEAKGIDSHGRFGAENYVYLYMIPQVLHDEGEAEDEYLIVDYTVKTWYGTDQYDCSSYLATAKLKFSHAMDSDGNEINWLPNKKITYNIVFDLSQDLIYWDPIVEAWDTSAGTLTVGGNA